MVQKTHYEVDMGQDSWPFPCEGGVKELLVRTNV